MKKKIFDFNPFFLKIINLNEKVEFINLNYTKIKLSHSLSFEDIFLTYFFLIKKINLNIFLLNTGKLFLKSLILIEKFKKKYKFNINIYSPNISLLSKYIKKYSLNAFYNNIILRKLCCYIRKVEPLNKALYNTDIWITGQRGEHSIYRFDVSEYSFDFNKNIIKCNLLINWNFQDLFYFLEKFNITINFIYNLGYLSIGCYSCTKFIYKDQDIRSGRWWWEHNSKKECGLHF